MKEKMLLDNVKKLKKWRILIAVFLAFVMSITLMCAVACGSGNPQEEKPGPNPEQPIDPGGSEDLGGLEDPSEIEDEKIVLKEIPEAGNVKLVDDAIREYLSASDVSEQIAALPKDKVSKDAGALPVKLAWNGNGSVKYTIYIADNENFDNAMSYVVSGFTRELDVYNLLPSTTYYWKVAGDGFDTSDTSVFKTEDLSVRLIYAEGTSNIRDLGGWSADGSFVNYGKIYRGNQLNGYGNWGNNKLTENGLQTFKDDLKIKTEIDLRTQDKDDANQTVNFVDASLPYYKYTIGQYTDILEPSVWNALPNDGNTLVDSTENKNDARRLSYATGNAVRNENAMRRSLKGIFDVLADERNYPVYIHCNAGADRTGTVAFLINGLLGVSEADLIRDFELTSFSSVSGLRYRSEIINDGFTEIGVMKNDYDNFVGFGALINAIKTNYGVEGGTLSYAIESFLTDYVGVSHEDIESLKRIMISDYTPVETEYVVGDRQVVEVAKTNNTLNLGDVAYSSVESISISNVSLGNSLDSIDGSKFENIYGERELTVVVNTENGKKIVKVPVLVVTKYISTAEDLISALTITSERNYGYYELKNDITLDSFSNEAKVAFSGRNGFCGILEGNGYTVTASLGNHGLFGYVIAGATIRNVNFAVSGGVNEAGKSVIGDYVLNSFIENVTISVSEGVPGIGVDGVGLVTTKSFNGNSVKKLSINAENAKLDSLFGFDKQYVFGGNNFASCVINAKYVKELARQYTDGIYVPVYLEDVYGFDGEITDTVEIAVADIINVEGSNIELNVGDRFKGSKVIGVETKGVEISECKFENGVLSLFNDRELFGEIGETNINITFEGVNGIRVKAQISVVIFTESEEVFLEETQEIFVDRKNNSVDLKQFSGATVYSISCNGYYFGNDINSLNIDSEFRANTLIHGNNTLTVLIGKDDKFYTLQIPVTVITKEISNVDQFNELLKSDNAEYAIYGYYKLTADIGDDKSEFNNGNDTNWQNVDGLYGFRGTLDGAGHSVTGTVFTRGLFGLVGKGAVIKNLTVNAYGFGDGRTVLARTIREAVVENVTINIKSGESDSYLTEGGIITALMSHSTIYRNVAINSDGKVDTLFGCSYWNYDPRKENTFENVKVTVKSIGGLLCLRANIAESLYTIDGVEGLTVEYVRSYKDENNTVIVGTAGVFTLGEENADVTEITSVTLDGKEIADFSFENGVLTVTAEGFLGSDMGVITLVLKGKAGVKAATVYLSVTVEVHAEEVTLEGNREIVLSSGTTFDVDLGEYTSATALSATLGGENATYSNGKLTIAEELRANTQKHGMQTLKVTVQKDGKYYNVTANVLIVTQDITTFEELQSALAFNENNVKFGYYRLKNNLTGYNWYQSGNNVGGGIWQNPTGELGFRGTLDGNNFSIQETFWNTGLFGYVGKGAVIKNITFNMNQYSSGKMLFGYSMIGATVDNVKVNVTQSSGGITAIPGDVSGLLTAIFSYGNTFNNLVVDAQNTDVDTLFGSCAYYSYPAAYEANKFTACTVKAKSLLGLACTDNANKIVTPYSGIDGLTVTLS